MRVIARTCPTCPSRPQGSDRKAREAFFRPWLALALIRHWQRVARERRQLKEMDERLLRDIGLSRQDARREAARPFWDARWP